MYNSESTRTAIYSNKTNKCLNITYIHKNNTFAFMYK